MAADRRARPRPPWYSSGRMRLCTARRSGRRSLEAVTCSIPERDKPGRRARHVQPEARHQGSARPAHPQSRRGGHASGRRRPSRCPRAQSLPRRRAASLSGRAAVAPHSQRRAYRTWSSSGSLPRNEVHRPTWAPAACGSRWRTTRVETVRMTIVRRRVQLEGVVPDLQRPASAREHRSDPHVQRMAPGTGTARGVAATTTALGRAAITWAAASEMPHSRSLPARGSREQSEHGRSGRSECGRRPRGGGRPIFQRMSDTSPGRRAHERTLFERQDDRERRTAAASAPPGQAHIWGACNTGPGCRRRPPRQAQMYRGNRRESRGRSAGWSARRTVRAASGRHLPQRLDEPDHGELLHRRARRRPRLESGPRTPRRWSGLALQRGDHCSGVRSPTLRPRDVNAERRLTAARRRGKPVGRSEGDA